MRQAISWSDSRKIQPKVHPVGKLQERSDWKDNRVRGAKTGTCGQARKRGLEPDERVCAPWQDREAGQNYKGVGQSNPGMLLDSPTLSCFAFSH